MEVGLRVYSGGGCSAVQKYERDGYLLVKRSFAAVECEALREEAHRLATWHQVIRPDNLRTEMWHHSGCAEINKYDPVVDVSPVFAHVAADARLTDVVAALFGEQPLLFKDKLISRCRGTEDLAHTKTTLGIGVSRPT